jgi:AI-2 transport protein TqsA
MILDHTDQNPGAKVLFSLACLVVIVFGLQFAAPILLPSALALFLAVLSLPMMVWLRKHGLPKAVAIILPLIVNVAVVFLLILAASSSVSELQRELPTYINTLQQLQVVWIESFEARTDIIMSDWVDTDLLFNPGAILGFAGGAVGWVTRLLSMTFLVFLIMAFMLSEAAVFPAKFQYLTGRKGLEDLAWDRPNPGHLGACDGSRFSDPAGSRGFPSQLRADGWIDYRGHSGGSS